jgi:hypothetical protein
LAAINTPSPTSGPDGADVRLGIAKVLSRGAWLAGVIVRGESAAFAPWPVTTFDDDAFADLLVRWGSALAISPRYHPTPCSRFSASKGDDFTSRVASITGRPGSLRHHPISSTDRARSAG